MSDNRSDVVLVTRDAGLRELIVREKPDDATLRCIVPEELNGSSFPLAGQYWIDLDAGIAPGPSDCSPRIYFHSQSLEDSDALANALLVRKPCAAGAIAVLWAGAASASRGCTAAGEVEGHASELPAWLLDLHELDLHDFCQRCIEILPERLGYAEVALYIHDAERRILTLAECNSKRKIDLAVSLTTDCDHPLAVAACSAQPLVADDLAEACRLRGMRSVPSLGSGGGAIVPLVTRGKLQGVLQLRGRATGGSAPITPPQVQFAEFLSRCLEHAQRYTQARIEARVDRLTGLFNYRWMIEALGKEVHRSQRHGSPLSLIMLDLDGLKSVNDRFGHLGGDALLRHTATKISAALRQIDSAARIGGDEFVVILPATDIDGARHVAQRALSAIRTDAPLIDQRHVHVAASLGVAQWEDGWDEQQLIAAADQAMYTAKRQGHNRLVCHPRARAPRSGRPASVQHIR